MSFSGRKPAENDFFFTNLFGDVDDGSEPDSLIKKKPVMYYDTGNGSNSDDDTATDSKVTLFDIKNESANKPTPLPPYKFPSEGRQNIHAKSIGWDVGIDSSLLYPVLEWHCAGAKYEFVGDVGDIGPRNHELESQLFRKRFASMIGHEINQLSRFTVKVEGEAKIAICKDFSKGGLHPNVLANLALAKYEYPTLIQQYTIPAVLTGKDIMGISQTGSGKTAGFLVPVVSILMGKAKKHAAWRPNPLLYTSDQAVCAEPLAVVIVPTRELAMQIYDEAQKLSYRSMLRCCTIYGGVPKKVQITDLQRGCDILIATPGRLLDMMTTSSKWLKMARVKFTIVDEADTMLKAEWTETMDAILKGGASTSSDQMQFLMFSATFSESTMELANKYLASDFTQIKVGRPGSTHNNIHQSIVQIDSTNKELAAVKLIQSMTPARVLIFCRDIYAVERMDSLLHHNRLPSEVMHSGLDQRVREKILKLFRRGVSPIMIATSVMARGIDVVDIDLVLQVDLPDGTEEGCLEYVHRIGRTGRIGNKGQATSFFCDLDAPMGPYLAKLLWETKHPIPQFLIQQYAPLDGNWSFDETKGPTPKELLPVAEIKVMEEQWEFYPPTRAAPVAPPVKAEFPSTVAFHVPKKQHVAGMFKNSSDSLGRTVTFADPPVTKFNDSPPLGGRVIRLQTIQELPVQSYDDDFPIDDDYPIETVLHDPKHWDPWN